MNKNSFSVTQKKAIKLLSVGTNYRQCCKMLKISRYTLWQWRKEAKFNEAVETEKQKYLTSYVEDLDSLKKKAIFKLTQFLDDDSIPIEKRISIAFDAINTAKTIKIQYLN